MKRKCCCGDDAAELVKAPKIFDGKYQSDYCRECWLEITEGILPLVTNPRGQPPGTGLVYRQRVKLGKTTG